VAWGAWTALGHQPWATDDGDGAHLESAHAPPDVDPQGLNSATRAQARTALAAGCCPLRSSPCLHYHAARRNNALFKELNMASFDHIILNGRPGGGKSELIDFIKKTPIDERRELFHIGDFVELDDFVWLWDKFVEDDLWEQLGEKRLYSRRHEHGYVQLEGDKLLDMLISKFNVTIKTNYAGQPGFYDDNTIFIEFARGVADGGFKRAYELLDEDILARSAILYISVSYAESQRKNEARYQEALKHSILAHRLPEESIIRFSSEHDWEAITDGAAEGYMDIKGVRVPFVTMNNEPELHDAALLNARYGNALTALKRLYLAR